MNIFEKYFEMFSEENYYSKDEIKYRIENLSLEEVWEYIAETRKKDDVKTIFKSKKEDSFFYYNLKNLHHQIKKLEEKSKLDFTKSATKQIKLKVMSDFLMEEALNSSAIKEKINT